MKKKITLIVICSAFIASVALAIATMSNGVICPFVYYQPKVPTKLKLNYFTK